MATSTSEQNILIVEDQEGPRQALVMILSPFYRGSTAETASAGLKCLAARATDLVIMDVGLPDYSGLELLRRVRTSGHTVKVIMMSGGGSVESAEEAMRLGAVAYLLKPFNLMEVLALVKDVLKACAAESIQPIPTRTHPILPA